MLRYMLSLIVICLTLTSFGYAQRDIEAEAIRIEKTQPPPPRRNPVGSKKAKIASYGVLFVLTEPPTANVTIKNSRGGEPKQYQSQEGQLRAELPPGKYDIVVNAANYYPSADPRLKGIVIKPSLSITLPAYLKPTMGSLIVGPIEADASILVDKRKPEDLNIKVSIKREEKQILFENVAEGSHTLSIAVPGFVLWEREKVEVEGGARTLITPTLKPAVINFVVKSEPGATIFIDGNNEGRVQENGALKVSTPYNPGSHTIRAEIEDKFEPNEVRGNFEVGEQMVEVKLTRIVSSPEYSMSILADTLQDFWDAPQTWQVIQGKVVVRGADLGLLKERRWADFTWIFDITFINDKGACWIVRARDKQNYYLFQLGGPKGAAPKYFRIFIFQNGRLKVLDNVPFVEDLSSPKDSYTIKVEASGPIIKHYIQRKNDPAPGYKPIHTLTDDKLPYGTIGFQAKDGEEFNVLSTTVMPDKPKLPATR
jgi:hypothetical protein